MLDRSDRIEDTGYVKWDLTLSLLCAWVLCFVCVVKGIKSSGKASFWWVWSTRFGFNKHGCNGHSRTTFFAGCLLHSYISVPRPGHSVLPRGDLGRCRKRDRILYQTWLELPLKTQSELILVVALFELRHHKLLTQPAAKPAVLGKLTGSVYRSGQMPRARSSSVWVWEWADSWLSPATTSSITMSTGIVFL